MSTKEDGYVNSIDELCYVKFGQSLIVKYFIAVKFFMLLSKTFQEIGSFFISFSLFLS